MQDVLDHRCVVSIAMAKIAIVTWYQLRASMMLEDFDFTHIGFNIRCILVPNVYIYIYIIYIYYKWARSTNSSTAMNMPKCRELNGLLGSSILIDNPSLDGHFPITRSIWREPKMLRCEMWILPRLIQAESRLNGWNSMQRRVSIKHLQKTWLL